MNHKKPEYLENMLQCFETLTEYIQGPCYENQLILISGSFLDLAANLLGIDTKVDNIKKKSAIKKKKTEEE